jgi:rhodanese-related sulfurtransferase/polyisoprenoid-binding protein YceI
MKLEKISVQSLHQMSIDDTDVFILDTLPNDRFEKAHLPGAQNACVFEVTFLDQVASLVTDKKTPIVVYGFSNRSRNAETAAEKLQRAGYTNIAILDGGIEQWADEGFSVEGSEPHVTAAAPLHLPDGTYAIDLDESWIEWTGRNPNTTHFGTIQLSQGEVTIKDQFVSGQFTIDMRTIKNINLAGDELQPVLEAHLQSDDFFFVELFPEAVYEITQGGPKPSDADSPVSSAPNYDINGSLTLRGMSVELNFETTLNVMPDGRLSAEAHLDFDRTRGGVIYGSSRFFEYLGMHLVFDLISVQMRIVTKL